MNKRMNRMAGYTWCILILIMILQENSYAQCPVAANVCLGATVGYTYTGSSTKLEWTVSGNNTINGNIRAKSITVTWSQAGTFTLTLEDTQQGVVLCPLSVTVVNPIAVVATSSVSAASVCSGTGVTLSLSTNGGGLLRWEESPNGTSWTPMAASNIFTYPTHALSSTTYFRAVLTSCSTTFYSSVSQVVVKAFDGISASGGGSFCTETTFYGSLIASFNTAQATFKRWQISTYVSGQWTGWSTFVENSAAVNYPFSTTIHSRYRAVAQTECSEIVSTPTEVFPVPGTVAGVLSSTKNSVYTIDNFSVLISGNEGSVQWSTKNAKHDWQPDVAPVDISIRSTTSFKAVVQNGTCPSKETGTITVTHIPVMTEQEINYVHSVQFSKEGLTEGESNPGAVSPPIEAIQYFDGLGRPAQTVNIRSSPLGYDVVQPVKYDAVGRETEKYLAYASDNINGLYKTDALVKQSNFYSSATQAASSTKPFAITIYEPSPLDRVLKQGAAGEVWQPSTVDPLTMTDKTIKMEYLFNGGQEVYHFVYDLLSRSVTSGNYYGINQLHKTATHDENNYIVVEFTDKDGHTVCKKVQSSKMNEPLAFASTYYIYDDLGNLVVVLPPEGVEKLKSALNLN